MNSLAQRARKISLSWSCCLAAFAWLASGVRADAPSPHALNACSPTSARSQVNHSTWSDAQRCMSRWGSSAAPSGNCTRRRLRLAHRPGADAAASSSSAIPTRRNWLRAHRRSSRPAQRRRARRIHRPQRLRRHEVVRRTGLSARARLVRPQRRLCAGPRRLHRGFLDLRRLRGRGLRRHIPTAACAT